MMRFCRGAAEVERTQHGENVCLKRSNKQFQDRDDQSQPEREWTSDPALEDEDQAKQAHQYDVTCRDVRIETNHECERLDENSKDLDWNQ
jgi:hypothetical protein